MMVIKYYINISTTYNGDYCHADYQRNNLISKCKYISEKTVKTNLKRTHGEEPS